MYLVYPAQRTSGSPCRGCILKFLGCRSFRIFRQTLRSSELKNRSACKITYRTARRRHEVAFQVVSMGKMTRKECIVDASQAKKNWRGTGDEKEARTAPLFACLPDWLTRGRRGLLCRPQLPVRSYFREAALCPECKEWKEQTSPRFCTHSTRTTRLDPTLSQKRKETRPYKC